MKERKDRLEVYIESQPSFNDDIDDAIATNRVKQAR